MNLVRRGDHILNKSGIPVGHVPADTEESARDLANAMYASGNYPAGLTPCFVAGINGDCGDYGGICPFWTEEGCDCPDDLPEVFRQCLVDLGIKESDWHEMSNEEKQQAVEDSTS